MTVSVVLHVLGLCITLMLGCNTFLVFSETYPQHLTSIYNVSLVIFFGNVLPLYTTMSVGELVGADQGRLSLQLLVELS